MLSVAESAIPAAIGAGSVLIIRHIARAIAAPGPLGAAETAAIKVSDLRRRYYRTAVSVMPTLLMILGFVVAATIPSVLWLDKPGFTYEAPLLSGFVCAAATSLASSLDRRLSTRHLAAAAVQARAKE